jgi:hypothetical protein
MSSSQLPQFRSTQINICIDFPSQAKNQGLFTRGHGGHMYASTLILREDGTTCTDERTVRPSHLLLPTSIAIDLQVLQ